jgi:hypothetical protein
MYLHLLRLWLSIAIVACPFVCRGDAAVCDVDGTAQLSSCCSHRSPAERSGEPAERSDEPSDSACQCICSGAIVEQSVALDDVFPFVPSACFAVVEQVATAVLLVDSRHIEFAPRLDGAMNPGRALRCLHQSYLC